MEELELRLRALEMILAERLALDPVPVFGHIEDTIRSAQEANGTDPARDVALAFLAQARGGFDPYSAGYGITSPDEQPKVAS